MTEHNVPDFQSVAEIAHELSVSEKHIRRLMKSGKLPYYMLEGAARIKRRDKEAYLESCRIQN